MDSRLKKFGELPAKADRAKAKTKAKKKRGKGESSIRKAVAEKKTVKKARSSARKS
jgi:hypothetical protein